MEVSGEVFDPETVGMPQFFYNLDGRLRHSVAVAHEDVTHPSDISHISRESRSSPSPNLYTLGSLDLQRFMQSAISCSRLYD